MNTLLELYNELADSVKRALTAGCCLRRHHGEIRHA